MIQKSNDKLLEKNKQTYKVYNLITTDKNIWKCTDQDVLL